MQIEKNVSLKSYNTFGIDVNAKYFANITSNEDLLTLSDHKHFTSENIFVLGGGSNILLTRDIDALTIKNNINGIKIFNAKSDTVDLLIGAGENWHNIVMYCIEKGYGGLENLSLIPGNVGAAPMQNIGAYGVEIKDTFQYLEAFHIPTLEIHRFDSTDCKFNYRDSIFKNKMKGQYIILNIVLRLSKKPEVNTSYGDIKKELTKMKVSSPTIKDVSTAIIKIRKSKLPDPKNIGNSGSFFKNPVVDISKFESIIAKYPDVHHYKLPNNNIKLAAGWLIQKSGWKGKTFNNFGVHKKQALVLVNYGGALGKDINDLSNKIIEDIYQKYNVRLEKEVNIM